MVFPPDPSINHNIAWKAYHAESATWFFRRIEFMEWMSRGSLLWVHGKRTVLLSPLLNWLLKVFPFYVAGSGKSILWFVVYFDPSSQTVGTHFDPVLQSYSTSQQYAMPDRPPSCTSTLTFEMKKNKMFANLSPRLSSSFPLSRIPVATSFMSFILHMETARGNPPRRRRKCLVPIRWQQDA